MHSEYFHKVKGATTYNQAEPHTQIGKKRKPGIDFLMTIMANGIARGGANFNAQLKNSSQNSRLFWASLIGL